MKAIFFDFFGVLSTPVYSPFIKQHIPEAEQPEWIAKLDVLDKADLPEPELVKQLSERTGMPEDAIWKEVDSLPRPNEALYRFISENIKGKYTLGLLTNVPRSLIDRVAGDRLDLFDIVIVSSDVKLIKPDPAIFKLAMQRASCSASDMTFVDDGPKNIEIAKTLGIDGILYTDLPTFKQALQARQ